MTKYYFAAEFTIQVDGAMAELRKLGRGFTFEDEYTLSFATMPTGAAYDILEKYGFERVERPQ